MTTAPTAPAGTLRMFTCTDPSAFADNPIGLLPEFRRRGWESCFAKSLFQGIPSLDETIEAGKGFVLNRATGIWPDGKQPMTVAQPRSRAKLGSEPRGLSEIAALEKIAPGLPAAVRKRTDRCRVLRLKSIVYVGGLPLNLFTSKTAAEREAMLDAMVAWVKACGFDAVGLDLTALDSQEWGKSPTMRLAEKLIAAGVEVCIEAQPELQPGMFQWIDGRFSCMTGPGNWYAPDKMKYLRPENSRKALNNWYLWLQLSVKAEDRIAQANDFASFGTPIVDFAGLPDSWWKRAA